jgi:hypothetical protein
LQQTHKNKILNRLISNTQRDLYSLSAHEINLDELLVSKDKKIPVFPSFDLGNTFVTDLPDNLSRSEYLKFHDKF